MTTVIVKNSRFISHSPVDIPKGTVKAELVDFQLDKSWDGMSVFIHWHNLGTKVEKRVLMKDPTQHNEIPWEVLTDLGELRMGLVGMDGETTVKPTIWLTFGRVVEGPDADGGEDTKPPTPGYLEQMVEQATQANEAAQAAQKAAEDAADSVASAGPYAEEAKKSAEAAKASQDAAATSAQQASQAAKDTQAAAGSIGDAVQRAEQAATAAGTAQRAAETAQTAAAQSAGTAQGSATTAIQAAQTAQGAATQAGQYLASVEADAQAAASSATAAGKSQEAAQGAAQTAANARDQATTAATTAQGHADAAGIAKSAAEQAATTAGNAQSGAEQAAQSAAETVGQATQAAQEAKDAAQAASTAQTGAATAEYAAQGHAQDADAARIQAQTAATEAEWSKSGAETAAKNAEEYARQALASVLPPATDIPDGYALLAQGGVPVWGEVAGVDKWRQIRNITLEAESVGFSFDKDESNHPFSLRKLLIVGLTYPNEAGDNAAYVDAKFNSVMACKIGVAPGGSDEEWRAFMGVFDTIAGIMLPIDVKNSSNGSTVKSILNYSISYSAGGALYGASPDNDMILSQPKSPCTRIEVVSWRKIGKGSRLVVWGVDA